MKMAQHITLLFLSVCLEIVSMTCPPYEIQEGSSCVNMCPKSKYLQKQTCVDACPQNTKRIISDLFKFCSYGNENVCLAQLCEDDYPYFYEMNCLKRCPAYTVEYNKTCLLQCPSDAPLVTVQGSNGIEFSGNKTCSFKCPSSHPFIFTTRNLMRCVNNCPEFTEVSWDDMECKLQCPIDKPFLFNRTCFTDCPETNRYKILTYTKYNKMFMCVDKCPAQTVTDDTRCVDSCPSGKYLYNSTCVLNCPDSSSYLYPRYQTNSLNVRPDIVNYGRASFMCVENCNPKGLHTDENSDLGYYHGRQFHLVFGKECTPKCPKNANYELNGNCLTSCPKEYPLHKPLFRSKKCVKTCEKFFFNNSCLDYCPRNARFINNNTCDIRCHGELPYYIESSWVMFNGGYQSINCRTDCPSNYFYYNESVCVKVCPKEANFEFNRTCSEQCPPSHKYKLKAGAHFKCVDECPIKLDFNDVCVQECPEHAKYQLNSTCHSKCSIEFSFKNIEYYTKKEKMSWRWRYTRAKRYHCLEYCPSHKFIYNDTSCVLHCPADANYASNGTCMGECPKLQEYKVWKGSFYKCVDICDSSFVFNKTCLNACPNEAIFQLQETCVPDCPDQHPYQYRNSTSRQSVTRHCLNACPSGTYSLNYTCVSKCPNTTFVFNTSCLQDCPDEHRINYTRNGHGFGVYTCVKRCPEKTVTYNGTCYDTCPEKLNSHMSVCISDCPTSHPYINLQSKMCVNECPEDLVVSSDNICTSNCTEEFPFIERCKCVRNCPRKRPLIEITPHGKKCYHQCPHHLLLKDNTNICIDKCPLEMLIVDSICKNIDSCPFHTYIEHSGIGRRCTNRCSRSFYLDGTKCVKECPKEKVIAGIECLEMCPQDLPLTYKHFSVNSPRVHCYHICPDGYLANGSICVDETDCSYSYNHICYQNCPAETVISGYKSCESNVIYIISAVISVIAVLVLLVVIYLLTWFTGTSDVSDSEEDLTENTCIILTPRERIVYSKRFKELLQTDEIKQLLKEIDDENIDGKEIVEEIDDGFKL